MQPFQYINLRVKILQIVFDENHNNTTLIWKEI